MVLVSSAYIFSSSPCVNLLKAFCTIAISFEDMIRLIEAVKLKPVVDKVFDFEHVREAYEYQESQQHVGKVVIKVSKH